MFLFLIFKLLSRIENQILENVENTWTNSSRNSNAKEQFFENFVLRKFKFIFPSKHIIVSQM